MSQQSSKNNNLNLDDSKAHAEEASLQMPSVSDIEIDQQGIVVNAVPISMVPPTERETQEKQLNAANESEEDVEPDVQDITTFGKKRVGVKSSEKSE
jgi:hypothetical protein